MTLSISSSDPESRSSPWIIIRPLIFRLTLFLSPLICACLLVIAVDPLKAFRKYDQYYGQNNFLELNRELICFNTFNRHFSTQKFNAFIFGNSRSLAISTKEWAQYLPEDAKPFHFDALGDTLWGVRNKLAYLEKREASIDFVLWALDQELLEGIANRSGYQVISPFQLSGESPASFYFTFIHSVLKPKVAIAFLDYSLFNRYRSYMSGIIRENAGAICMDPITADLYYKVEQDIQENPESYYSTRKDIFYSRPAPIPPSSSLPTRQHIQLINEISSIIQRCGTQLKIIVNPLYNQVPLDPQWIELLQSKFGESVVWDFSGSHPLTQPIENYYETSHYRPHVAREMLKIIYEPRNHPENL